MAGDVHALLLLRSLSYFSPLQHSLFLCIYTYESSDAKCISMQLQIVSDDL